MELISTKYSGLLQSELAKELREFSVQHIKPLSMKMEEMLSKKDV
jgi:hypothetical protein